MSLFDAKKYSQYTIPIIKEYSNKYNHDFICFNEEEYKEFGKSFFNYDFKYNFDYLKFKIKELFNIYDRICWIDADIFIKKNSPDIFSCYKEDMVMLNESEYNPLVARVLPFYWFLGHYGAICQMSNVMQADPNIFKINGEKYYNFGVFLLSKEHSVIFEPPVYHIIHFYAQSYINYQILKYDIKIKDLDYRFNFMKEMNNLKSEDVFFIHLAGIDNREEKVKELIKKHE
jgi:hypothetical protein